MEKEYYTVKEFAQLVNISRITILKAIQSGRISAIKVGCAKKSPYRIPRHQIDKLTLLTEQEIKGE